MRECLEEDDLWEVFQLRAVVLLEERVTDQLDLLLKSTVEKSAMVRDRPWELAMRLRDLEGDLLQRARKKLEDQVWCISTVLQTVLTSR